MCICTHPELQDDLRKSTKKYYKVLKKKIYKSDPKLPISSELEALRWAGGRYIQRGNLHFAAGHDFSPSSLTLPLCWML